MEKPELLDEQQAMEDPTYAKRWMDYRAWEEEQEAEDMKKSMKELQRAEIPCPNCGVPGYHFCIGSPTIPYDPLKKLIRKINEGEEIPPPKFRKFKDEPKYSELENRIKELEEGLDFTIVAATQLIAQRDEARAEIERIRRTTHPGGPYLEEMKRCKIRLREERDDLRSALDEVLDQLRVRFSGDVLKAVDNLLSEVEEQDKEIASLKARIERILCGYDARADLEEYVQAVGLASTCVPDMEIDPANPIGMMQKVVTELAVAVGLVGWYYEISGAPAARAFLAKHEKGEK